MLCTSVFDDILIRPAIITLYRDAVCVWCPVMAVQRRSCHILLCGDICSWMMLFHLRLLLPYFWKLFVFIYLFGGSGCTWLAIWSRLLTLRLLMSYIYMEHLFLMFLDHIRWRSTVGMTPLDEW